MPSTSMITTLRMDFNTPASMERAKASTALPITREAEASWHLATKTLAHLMEKRPGKGIA